MNLRISIYDRGIRHALSLSSGDLQDIFDAHFIARTPRKSDFEMRNQVIRRYKILQNDLKKEIRNKDHADVGDNIVRMISMLETSLDHEGLLKSVGGLKNIHIQPVLTGFLRGEDGKYAEMPIEGSEIGQVGSDRPWGPMSTTQREIGMSESEFFVYWLMQRI